MGKRRKRITIFSWGYYGWGNATKQFVRALNNGLAPWWQDLFPTEEG